MGEGTPQGKGMEEKEIGGIRRMFKEGYRRERDRERD